MVELHSASENSSKDTLFYFIFSSEHVFDTAFLHFAFRYALCACFSGSLLAVHRFSVALAAAKINSHFCHRMTGASVQWRLLRLVTVLLVCSVTAVSSRAVCNRSDEREALIEFGRQLNMPAWSNFGSCCRSISGTGSAATATVVSAQSSLLDST